MAGKYRLLEKSLIAENGDHGVLHEAGTEIGDGTRVPFTGMPGPHMEPMDDAARAEIKKAEKRCLEQGGAWINPNQVMNSLPLARSAKEATVAEEVADFLKKVFAKAAA